MDKREYFLKAISLKNHHILDWVISCFTIVEGDAPRYYDYCLSQTAAGFYANTPEQGKVQIQGATIGQPLYKVDEEVTIRPGEVENVSEEITTTYGRLLVNILILIDPFGKKIPYINKKFSIPDVEDIVTLAFENDPVDEKDRQVDKFYVSEYKRFAQACFYLTGFTQIFTWAATLKNILPPEGIEEFKAKLLAQYKDHLNDPVVIAKIEKELVEFDAKWRGDDPGNRFLISEKSRNLVRKQKVLMYGAETISTGNGEALELHTNSLSQGWTQESLTSMCTTARYKSYSRGAETALGGVEVKWLLRASGNINVTVDDCGSTMGILRTLTADDVKKVIGYSIATPKGSITLEDEAQVGAYLGKVVFVRSSMYCKLPFTDYCKRCIGPKLANTPYALSSAVSAYGSAFLLASLGAAHSKAISVADMDLNTDLS